MSNSKRATAEVMPIDEVLAIVFELLNDVERRFLSTVSYTSDQEMVLRIVRHIRSTLIFYDFGPK